MQHIGPPARGFWQASLLGLAAAAAVVFVAVLGAVAWSAFRQGPINTAVPGVHSTMRTAHTALEAYRIDHGRYPTTQLG